MSKRRTVVAVIDDNSSMLCAMNNILNVFGYDTELYGSVQAFLDGATNSQASCLIVDVQIGASRGLDLVQRLGELGLRLPIIFMTARDDEQIEKQAERADCVALLRKPFPAGALIEAINKSRR